MRNIPNAITGLNLAAGFVAILINDPLISPLLILMAGILDLLDGTLARLLKANSNLGEQLDSLSDMVSFGIAPAYLFYHFLLGDQWYDLVLICFFPVMAALRLAIFNTQKEQVADFIGLPSPSAGLLLAFLVYSFGNDSRVVLPEWLFMLIPIVVALLMVSPVPMLSLKNWRRKPRAEWVVLIIQGIGTLLLFGLYQFDGVWMVFLLYIILSIVYSLFFAGRHASPF